MKSGTNRTATAPTWGAIRDAAIATVTTAIGAYVLSRTGSPELSDAAQQFTGTAANAGLGVFVGLGVYLRKLLSEKLAAS